MQRDVFIEWDLESTPLEIRTDSVLGSNQMVKVNFYSASGQDAGHVQLYFGFTLQYYLDRCSHSWTNLPVTLPSATDKFWRITLTKTAGVRVVIHCNDVEVVNELLSEPRCSSSWWSTVWNRDVTKIKFYSDRDTASDNYRAGD